MKKSKPVKKGNVTFEHNLYDVLGHTLWTGIKQGKLDPRMIGSGILSANLGIDLGKLAIDIGYNQPNPRGGKDKWKAGFSVPIK